MLTKTTPDLLERRIKVESSVLSLRNPELSWLPCPCPCLAGMLLSMKASTEATASLLVACAPALPCSDIASCTTSCARIMLRRLGTRCCCHRGRTP